MIVGWPLGGPPSGTSDFSRSRTKHYVVDRAALPDRLDPWPHCAGSATSTITKSSWRLS
jgi:hypothetical protein